MSDRIRDVRCNARKPDSDRDPGSDPDLDSRRDPGRIPGIQKLIYLFNNVLAMLFNDVFCTLLSLF